MRFECLVGACSTLQVVSTKRFARSTLLGSATSKLYRDMRVCLSFRVTSFLWQFLSPLYVNLDFHIYSVSILSGNWVVKLDSMFKSCLNTFSVFPVLTPNTVPTMSVYSIGTQRCILSELDIFPFFFTQPNSTHRVILTHCDQTYLEIHCKWEWIMSAILTPTGLVLATAVNE